MLMLMDDQAGKKIVVGCESEFGIGGVVNHHSLPRMLGLVTWPEGEGAEPYRSRTV